MAVKRKTACASILQYQHSCGLLPATRGDETGSLIGTSLRQARHPLELQDQPRTLALGARLPTMCGRELVEAGFLMSYGPNPPDLYHRAAEFADKILRGAKPADIPVEHRADEVIE